MNRLTYFIKLNENKNNFTSAKRCKLCSNPSGLIDQLNYFGNEYCNLCLNEYCESNKNSHPLIKMADLFNEFRVIKEQDTIEFKMGDRREYMICLDWLDEIGHNYKTKLRNLYIKSDIDRKTWYQYLSQQ